MIINDQTGIISVKGTTSNVDDKKPISEMADEFFGVLIRRKRLYL
ncbi:hypothetical protein [Candidatus Enterovibrio escicola]